MPRPYFPLPGYWLGMNGKICVHMGQGGVPNSELYYLGSPKGAPTDNSGVVDHVAFFATGPESFIKRFKEGGIAYRPRSFPTPCRSLHIVDHASERLNARIAHFDRLRSSTTLDNPRVFEIRSTSA